MSLKSFKIVSYNCNSAKNNVDTIRSLIDQYDIVCLQETFLSKDDLLFIYGLRENINFCISDCVYNVNMNIGRPKGGLLTIWKARHDQYFVPVFSNESYQAIKIKAIDGDILLCNIYLPYDDHSTDQLIRYREVIASLSHDIECNPGCKINIVGDYNADPSRPRLWGEIVDFCNEYELVVADLSLPAGSFTYLHPAHDSTSWLDHVLTSTPDNVSNIMILHYLALYDHFPISFELVVNMDLNSSTTYGVEPKLFVDWRKFNSCKARYENILDSFFAANINTNFNVLSCEDVICENPYHKRQIDEMYAYLIKGLLSASDNFLHERKDTYKQVPGWNVFCKNAHIIARQHFLQWKEEGMPRNGYLYDVMKSSRANFRTSLRLCRENEQRLRQEGVVSSFHEKDFKSFWRQISVKQKSKVSSMDGVNNYNDIARLFESKYFQILNDQNCQSEPDIYDENVKKVKDSVRSCFYVTATTVENNCMNLKEAIGFDNIHTNHLKFATGSCLNFITLLFNSMIRHAHFPAEMLRGEIRPILKNKSGKINESENYRPVMISSNILKLFEKCIQLPLVNSLKIHRNQFGFRQHTSTNMTVTVVKEIIYNYKQAGSTVFGGFIDLSKAFDKVNHRKLLNTIFSNSDLSPNLKLVIQSFLLNQSAYINFNGFKSDVHHIGNGCRQGGINSPLFFNFYINNMIKSIVNTKIGCQLALNNYNIIAYADDLILLSPSQSGLQYLLNKVYEHLLELDLSINTIKSKVLVFRSGTKPNYNVQFLINNVAVEIVHSIKYLGIILSDDMSHKLDIERQSKAFLKQSFGFLRKFASYPIDLKIFLFRTYCLSMFGSELWCDLKGCSQAINALKISFHKGVKKVLGLPFRSSNHEACIAANMLTFDHFRNNKMFNYGFLIKNSKSLSLRPLRGYLMRKSVLMKYIENVAESVYNINNIFNNDRDALQSRILYVFMREPRFVGLDTILGSTSQS